MESYNLRKNSQENYMTYLNIWLGTDSLYLAPLQYKENKKFLSKIGTWKMVNITDYYSRKNNRTTTQNANKILVL